MEEYRFQKLETLLNHCFKYVPAYRYLMEDTGINPSNIKSLDVIKQFPVIDKQFVLDHYNDFIPTNLKTIKGLKSSKTSGSTGQVLTCWSDANTRSMIWGSFLRFQDWMGRDFNNLYIILRGRNIIKESAYAKIKESVTDILENSKTLDAYDLGDRNVEKIIEILAKNPKAILRGYVLNVVDVATILKKTGNSYSIQAVSTTAEPLLDFHRSVIMDTFNCGIFDQYGCGEVGGIAYECDHHKGMHITEEHLILETNENNEVILTDLDNFSFPLIRYKNGDEVLLSNCSCTCGRKSQMIKKVLGRTSDNVIGLNGLPLHWGYFHHLLIYTHIATNRNLIKFQIVQNKIDDFTLNLQSDPLTVSEKNTIIQIMRKDLGNISVSIKNVDSISSSENGKFKAVISKINRKNN